MRRRRGAHAGRAAAAVVVAMTALTGVAGGRAGAFVSTPYLEPGVTIFSGNEYCTAGFVVAGAHGVGILTAGHCHRQDTVRAQTLSGSGEVVRPQVGTFDRWRFTPDLDLAVVGVDQSSLPVRPEISGAIPVTGTVSAQDLTAERPRMCLQGQTSGLVCGAYVWSDGRRAKFDVTPRSGDSGGPVFVESAYGASARAVGELLGTTPDGHALVELIAPRLDAWGLRLQPVG